MTSCVLQLNKRMKPGFIDHISIRFGLGLMNESDFGTDKNNKDFRIIWPEHIIRLFECYYFLTFRIKIGSNVKIIIYAQSSKSRYFSDEIISPPLCLWTILRFWLGWDSWMRWWAAQRGAGAPPGVSLTVLAWPGSWGLLYKQHSRAQTFIQREAHAQ